MSTQNLSLGVGKPAQGVSIIIPLLNEAAIIDDLIEHLSLLGADEIIIVDGGSQDGTQQALSGSGFKLIESEAGRATQMNAGAAIAKHEILLFLHADTRLPKTFLREIKQANVWGRFDVRFDHSSIAMKVIAMFMNARSRLTGISTGDQAIFVRAGVLAAIGGFPDVAIMEDIALSKRLKKIELPYCSKKTVVTSARRWQQNGVAKTVFKMWWYRLAYFLGVSPRILKNSYHDVR